VLLLVPHHSLLAAGSPTNSKPAAPIYITGATGVQTGSLNFAHNGATGIQALYYVYTAATATAVHFSTVGSGFTNAVLGTSVDTRVYSVVGPACLCNTPWLWLAAAQAPCSAPYCDDGAG
jgi:hypothetical protein